MPTASELSHRGPGPEPDNPTGICGRGAGDGGSPSGQPPIGGLAPDRTHPRAQRLDLSHWGPGPEWDTTQAIIGTWVSITGSIRSKMSSSVGPVIVRPWFLRPTIAWAGSASSRMMSATATASSAVPHG